jgi:TPR repeat protein
VPNLFVVGRIQVDQEVVKKAMYGDEPSLSMIGDEYFNTGDLYTASFWYQMAANKDHSHSQFRLGFFLPF